MYQIDGMPEIYVSDKFDYGIGQRNIEVYIAENNYFSILNNVPQDWLPDKIKDLIKAKYENDKNLFIDGKQVR
jgi:hypothetical protein